MPSHLQSQSSVGDLGGVTGVDGQRSGKLDTRGKSVNVHFDANYVCVHVCVLVCVAPPIVVGAWSMAGALRQLFEYYYYCYPAFFWLCAFAFFKATTHTNNTLLGTTVFNVLRIQGAIKRIDVVPGVQSVPKEIHSE